MDKQEKFFCSAGDFGCDGESNWTIDAVIKKNPELIISLGDTSYKESAFY